jgi:hypothetical protein
MSGSALGLDLGVAGAWLPNTRQRGWEKAYRNAAHHPACATFRHVSLPGERLCSWPIGKNALGETAGKAAGKAIARNAMSADGAIGGN